jgi:hypothetical protein
VSEQLEKPERSTLSRDFSEFLVELSIALHKHAMYPSGHPSLEPAAASVAARAAILLTDRPMIALGVARHQLIIEGVATAPEHPVLRRLADGLHRHHLGAVSISRGADAKEIGEALRALAAEPERDGPLGLMLPDQRPSWSHVRLHPLTFDGLVLAADVPLAEDGQAGPGGSRTAELWVGLARAAMAGDSASLADGEVETEPTVVARAIDEHRGTEAYDQVVVGYMLQIARALKQTSGIEAEALKRRISKLIRALKPDTLRRLIEMGGDVAQRGAFVRDATHGMAVDAVVDILKAAAEASGQTISHGLVRMLSKLAAHAESGTDAARPEADRALRDQVEKLLSNWHLADPNPEDYGRLLQHLATSGPLSELTSGQAGPGGEAGPMRVVQMSLETGSTGPMVDRAIDQLIESRLVGSLLQLLPPLKEARGEAAEAIRERLLRPETIDRMTAHDAIDAESLDQLVPLLPLSSYGILLDALAASENRATRRKLIDRLAQARQDITPLIAKRLEDPRWYVRRNMLLLLELLGKVPAGFSVSRWTGQEDHRVRQEAVRLQLTLPREREQALRTALADSHPRIISIGLSALQEDCPADVVHLVARVVTNPDAPDELRQLAVHALGQSRQSMALETLLRLVDGGKTLLGRPRLAAKSPTCVAALQELAAGWSSNPTAKAVLAVAARSSDPEIRNAARNLRS